MPPVCFGPAERFSPVKKLYILIESKFLKTLSGWEEARLIGLHGGTWEDYQEAKFELIRLRNGKLAFWAKYWDAQLHLDMSCLSWCILCKNFCLAILIRFFEIIFCGEKSFDHDHILSHHRDKNILIFARHFLGMVISDMDCLNVSSFALLEMIFLITACREYCVTNKECPSLVFNAMWRGAEGFSSILMIKSQISYLRYNW